MYATIGERGQGDVAQDLNSHAGSIIRINLDGTIPENPYLNDEGALAEIFMIGVRNPQGMALTKDNEIYISNHGAKGGDFIGLVDAKKNYGWPAITYGRDYSGAMISPFKEKDGMEQPIKYWVPSIAPSGMAYYTGTLFSEWTDSIFVSALVPGDVRRLKVKGSNVLEEEILFSDLGRIRDVATSPDGSIILATDGPNGKLIRVVTK